MNNRTAVNHLSLDLRFLRGGGEMGERIREFDWGRTPLGNPATWSISLKTAVGIMLNSGAPAYIAWGQSFIQLYNDAYIPILGPLKHPFALGIATPQTWHEIWDFVGPLFRSVISAGDVLSFKDQLLVMQRKGYPEACYFSFSYSPLTDEAGNINGVFVTAWETTETVISHRRSIVLKRLAELLEPARSIPDIRNAFSTVVSSHRQDLPFGMWYEWRADHAGADLVAKAGVADGTPFVPSYVDLDADTFYGGKIDASGLETVKIPIGDEPIVWDQSDAPQFIPRQLCVLPLCSIPKGRPSGFLVLGMSGIDLDDQSQRNFLEEARAHIERALQRVSQDEFERREWQHQFESVLQAIPCLVWMSNTSKECIFFNQTWLAFRGSSHKEEVAGAWIDAIHPDDVERVHVQYEIAFEKQATFLLEYRLRRADGAYRWILDQSTPRYDSSGDFLGYIGICLDITESRKTAEALVESKARYRQIVETSQEGIWILDGQGKTTFANPKMEEMLGCQTGEMDGRSVFEFMDDDVRDDAMRLMEQRRNGIAEQHEFRLRKADGSQLWVLMSTCPFKHGETAIGVLGMVTDITDRKRHESEIQHLATHDALTDLPNRTLLHRRIEQAIHRAQRMKREIAVLFIDFDNFKYVNDSYGHSLGDVLLQVAAAQLQSLMKAEDTVARLGGDEFVVMVSDLVDASVTAVAVARRIRDAFTNPIRAGDRELTTTTSIGISVYPTHALNVEDLLKHADTAMYRSKESGRNSFQVYQSEMSSRALARTSLEAALRRALELNQFELHYQPQVSLATGIVIGAEALLRWHHPEMGMIPPSTFIPVAEDIGLITSIGTWVLQTACAQNKAWQVAGLPPLVMAVNLSAVQMRQTGFADIVSEILQTTGLAPSYLDLEITESVLVAQTDSLVALLERLKTLGVMISLDDFGTGYSNLGYLQRFPLTRLKIDRSFVSGLPENRDSVAITKAIISMGHGLGLQVLAEGVETTGQAAFLDTHSCEYAQGYLYAKPLPATLFEDWLKEQLSDHQHSAARERF